jgi:hypothetical protein
VCHYHEKYHVEISRRDSLSGCPAESRPPFFRSSQIHGYCFHSEAHPHWIFENVRNLGVRDSEDRST